MYHGSTFKSYHRNSGAQLETPGFTLLPKLNNEHVYLSAFSKMRVDVAAQVYYSHMHACGINLVK